MDIHLPGESGIVCTPRLREKLPHVQVIMLPVYKAQRAPHRQGGQKRPLRHLSYVSVSRRLILFGAKHIDFPTTGKLSDAIN